MGLEPVDLHGSQGLSGIILGSCFGFVATIAVVLRIISRRLTKNPLGADDYMIVMALVGNILPLEEKMQLTTSTIDLLLWLHRLQCDW